MQITPDSGLFAALSRAQDAQRVPGKESARKFDSALTEFSSTQSSRASGVQKVPSAVRAEALAERAAQRERERGEDTAFSREAPTGPRPKYQAKGQNLNILV
jgi:hypothetical protein